jgi:hypothetical protein
VFAQLPDGSDLPAGYVHVTGPGRIGVVREWAAAAVAKALAQGTLKDWAAAQEPCERFCGRGIAYGVCLPSGAVGQPAARVVVRRNRHGGWLRALTGELFVGPTRAPLELATALRLAAGGVPTPEVVAFAVYPIAAILARSDVMTRRLPAGQDLPAAWREADATGRTALLTAVAVLLKSLRGANAWHPDLNLKNLYVADTTKPLTAYVLDVDRIRFCSRSDVASLNFARLARSARKWRERWGLDFSEPDLDQLAALAGDPT